MSNVRDIGGTSGFTPVIPQDSTTSSTRAAETTSAKPTIPVEGDTAVRVRPESSLATSADSVLPPPSTPNPTLTSEETRGAYSFSSQLTNVGAAATSTENMLAQYLKLQMESQSMSQWAEAMSLSAKHSMLGAAAASAKSSTLADAASLRAQAGQYEAQVNAILDQAGVDKNLAEQCYDSAKATGQTDEQALQSYLDTRKSQGADDETLAREEAAIRQAAPIAEEADALATRAGAIDGNYMSSLGAVATIRAGTIGMDALLKNQEAQVQLSNDIAQILGGGRKASARRSQDAWLEVDSHRNEIAKLVLNIVDKHQAANVGKAGNFRS